MEDGAGAIERLEDIGTKSVIKLFVIGSIAGQIIYIVKIVKGADRVAADESLIEIVAKAARKFNGPLTIFNVNFHASFNGGSIVVHHFLLPLAD